MWVIRISKDYNHHLELNVQLLWWAKHWRFCCKKGHIHSSYWLQPSGDKKKKNRLRLWLKCKLQNWREKKCVKTEKSNCKKRTLVRSHLAGRSTERRPRDDDWWCPTMVSNWKPQPALQNIQISTTLVTGRRTMQSPQRDLNAAHRIQRHQSRDAAAMKRWNAKLT